MPVTYQWKSKQKAEEQTTAASQSPPTQPAAKKGTAGEDASEKKGKTWKKDDKKAKQEETEKEEEAERSAEDEDSSQPGRIRNLAGFFATQKDEPKSVKKKRFEVADDPQTIILENEPVERLEGVVRADDPGEWQKPIELEKGWAKNMANLFLNRQHEDTSSSRKPFVMDIEEGAQTIVLENEPVRLEGVVRSVDKTEDVIGKRGRIKNIAGRFANEQADNATDGGSYRKEHADIDPSRSRNIADKWRNQQLDEPSSPTSTSGAGGKPKWMLELESAKEYGVFENEPEVRSDVVRADDEQPDVISAQHTRNLRKMWSQIEKEEVRDQPSKRPDIVIRPKKKEPSPEPEPPPVEEPKPARRFGGKVGGAAGAFGAVYGKQAKKEKTPPPPEPEPPKQETRRGFRQVGKSTAQPSPAAVQPPVPEPDPKNPFKTALKPVPKRK